MALLRAAPKCEANNYALSGLRVEWEYLQLDGGVLVCARVWLIRQMLAVQTQDSNLAGATGKRVGNSCCECCGFALLSLPAACAAQHALQEEVGNGLPRALTGSAVIAIGSSKSCIVLDVVAVSACPRPSCKDSSWHPWK